LTSLIRVAFSDVPIFQLPAIFGDSPGERRSSIAARKWEHPCTAASRSANFQVGCVADFQIREPGECDGAGVLLAADLEIGDTAGLETCATVGGAQMRRNEICE